ncbi:MAG: Rrf2 family transcriptional regulator [Shinella sp.]|uniref:Rrf2 family transcriptional regulator n=1 Tax=Shinella sp. TaxID=1870904 RepID=UPI003C759720
MRLTFHTDYAMRMLIHVAMRPDHVCTVNDVAQAYRFSRNQLAKVAKMLRDLGLVETAHGCGRPGRNFHWPNACRREGGHEALAAFLAVLDKYTLADIVQNRVSLGPLLGTDTVVAWKRREDRWSRD